MTTQPEIGRRSNLQTEFGAKRLKETSSKRSVFAQITPSTDQFARWDQPLLMTAEGDS